MQPDLLGFSCRCQAGPLPQWHVTGSGGKMVRLAQFAQELVKLP
jgi:hypothetical protein